MPFCLRVGEVLLFVVRSVRRGSFFGPCWATDCNGQHRVIVTFGALGPCLDAAKVGYRCDYTAMLQNMVRQNPQQALAFAKKAATAEPPQVRLLLVAQVSV